MATKKNNNEGEDKKKKKSTKPPEEKSTKKYKRDPLKDTPVPYVESYMSYQLLTPYNPPPKAMTAKMDESHPFFDNLGKAAINLVKTDCEQFGYRHLVEFLEETEDGIKTATNEILEQSFREFRPYVVWCERVAIIPFVYGECLGVNESFSIYQELYKRMLSKFMPVIREPSKVKQYQGNACLIAMSYSIMELHKPCALFARYGGSNCEFQRIVFNEEEPYDGDDGIDDEEY